MFWIKFLSDAVWILSLVSFIYALYFVVIGIFSAKRPKRNPEFAPKHRFAVVIAARNEEQVIGNLVRSLKEQNYPADLINVIVVPNNCTDQTAQAALDAGAVIMEPPAAVNSKGKVLSYVFQDIFQKQDRYDAFCVFDADNLVHPDFFCRMNDALCAGVKVAQGYRDSKNPSDTWTSSCYSIYYLAVNRLMNHARSALGMSAAVNGSGFMVRADVLRDLGGWNTVTLAEDIEFTVQCALKGYKIAWVPDAVIYDEQPLTLMQSWTQRRRWSGGILQTGRVYFKKLVKAAFSKKSFACFDLLMTLWAPIMQALFCITFVITSVLGLMYVNYELFPRRDLFYALFFSFNYSYLMAVSVSLYCIYSNKKSVIVLWKGVFTFWFFIMVWMPINILSIFSKPKVWKPIKHTREVTISEIPAP